MVTWIGLAGHGTQVVAENPGALEPVNGVPGTEVAGLRQGWGTTFRGRAGAGTWFHQPVPALNLYGHTATRVGDLLLAFEARGTAHVTSIHVWSGDVRLRTFDGLNLTGKRQWTQLFNPEIELPGVGVNICALVNFGATDSEVTFLGGYARYVAPETE